MSTETVERSHVSGPSAVERRVRDAARDEWYEGINNGRPYHWTVHKHEWQHAWHYARYDRRHGQISAFVGPELQRAARWVMEGQGRDRLGVRAAMHTSTSPRTAFLYTSRAGTASAGLPENNCARLG